MLTLLSLAGQRLIGQCPAVLLARLWLDQEAHWVNEPITVSAEGHVGAEPLAAVAEAATCDLHAIGHWYACQI